MRALAKTEGLILDVRDNSGGSRQILRALFPHFMQSTDAPYVANVARYRLTPGLQRLGAEALPGTPVPSIDGDY